MANKIRVLACRVGEQPKIEEIENVLETLQAFVKGKDEDYGLISVVELVPGIMLVCNDNGMYECEFNREVPGLSPEMPKDAEIIVRPKNAAAPGTIGVHKIFGNFFLCRVNRQSGDFASLKNLDIDPWTQALSL